MKESHHTKNSEPKQINHEKSNDYPRLQSEFRKSCEYGL